ncbi:MAG: hypothetical protein RIM80_03260, partial [Alphaproteobacteria bacterium]
GSWLSWIERLALFGFAVVLVHPDLVTDLIGIVGVGGLWVLRRHVLPARRHPLAGRPDPLAIK